MNLCLNIIARFYTPLVRCKGNREKNLSRGVANCFRVKKIDSKIAANTNHFQKSERKLWCRTLNSFKIACAVLASDNDAT